jgi:WD40 repeat protein
VTASGELLHTLRGHIHAVRSVAICMDGQYTISGSDDHTVRIWVTESGTLLHTLTGHCNSITSVVLSMDKKHIISCADKRCIRISLIESGETVRALTCDQRAYSLAISLNGEHVAFASVDQDLHAVQLWSTKSDAMERRLVGHSGPVNCIGFSADGLQQSATAVFIILFEREYTCILCRGRKIAQSVCG